MGDDCMNGSWPMFSTSTSTGLDFRDLIALEVMKMIYPKNLTNEQIAEDAYLMADEVIGVEVLRAREGKCS